MMAQDTQLVSQISTISQVNYMNVWGKYFNAKTNGPVL